jgi:hypothetical protein
MGLLQMTGGMDPFLESKLAEVVMVEARAPPQAEQNHLDWI